MAGFVSMHSFPPYRFRVQGYFTTFRYSYTDQAFYIFEAMACPLKQFACLDLGIARVIHDNRLARARVLLQTLLSDSWWRWCDWRDWLSWRSRFNWCDWRDWLSWRRWCDWRDRLSWWRWCDWCDRLSWWCHSAHNHATWSYWATFLIL